MSVSTNFGMFLLEAARGEDRTRIIPEQDARNFQSSISTQISDEIEKFRTEQRKSTEDSFAITVF